jgi:uncharacterized protein (DUF433 family)
MATTIVNRTNKVTRIRTEITVDRDGDQVWITRSDGQPFGAVRVAETRIPVGDIPALIAALSAAQEG